MLNPYIVNISPDRKRIRRRRRIQRNKKAMNRSNEHPSAISESRISELVEKMIANKSVNIGILPNYVERHLYKNLLTTLMGMLEEVINESKIEFMGHRIVMKLVPIE
jgi:hypothetical protein